MPRSSITYNGAMQFDCPKCIAVKGQDCVSKFGNKLWEPHKARLCLWLYNTIGGKKFLRSIQRRRKCTTPPPTSP